MNSERFKKFMGMPGEQTGRQRWTGIIVWIAGSILFLASVVWLAGCEVVVDPGCVYDWECGYNEVCDNGVCVYYDPGFPSGHTILECGCWYSTMGERRTNLNCMSGYDVTFACNWWCPGGGFAWGRMCE